MHISCVFWGHLGRHFNSTSLQAQALTYKHAYLHSVKHPSCPHSLQRRSLRVSFEVPVVDGFNQLLGHLDNLLLTSWGETQTQSYRGRQSGMWQLTGILPLPSWHNSHLSSFLRPEMMLHCSFTLICLQCTPVSTRKLNARQDQSTSLSHF